ncbi:MAG: hypothetical protein H6563_07645 [Lewinellaceae bacterium]|nr:hypothetical protein [Lewinellaceae bacterium]
MIRILVAVALGGLVLFGSLSTSSCKHYPVEDIIPPVDTTTNPPPEDTLGTPCDPNVVYFDLQVLPILISNCAMPGCHDVDSHQEDVVLTSYENVMNTADVTPYDPNESKLYRMITETDPDKIMPQPPQPPLNADQIGLIGKWILQGAQDLSCDPDAGGCDTTNVSFSGYVLPLLQNQCKGCHGAVNPVGGFSLVTYQDVKSVALTGQLYGAIAHDPAYSPMPKGGPQWSDCRIRKIGAWINAGAQDN